MSRARRDGLCEAEGAQGKVLAEVFSRRVWVAEGSEHLTVLHEGNQGNEEFCWAPAKSFSTLFNMRR